MTSLVALLARAPSVTLRDGKRKEETVHKFLVTTSFSSGFSGTVMAIEPSGSYSVFVVRPIL